MESKNYTESDFVEIRNRISTVNNIKMNDKLFNQLADEFAKELLEKLGLDLLNKFKFHAPMMGKFYQLQYSVQ